MRAALAVSAGLGLSLWAGGLPSRAAAASGGVVPLCPGLTIVTAVSQRQGDYESIKRVEAVTAQGVRLRYSSYMPDPRGDYDSTTAAHPPWVPFMVYRTMRAADVESASIYLQRFASEGIPETVSGTTSLGISRQTFRQLKSKGRAPLEIYMDLNPNIPLREDGTTSFGWTYRFAGELTLVSPKPVSIPLLVNDQPVTLPALHVRGTFMTMEGEFYFLDDPLNPVSLRFETVDGERKDQLRVISLSYPPGCPADGWPGGAGPGGELDLRGDGKGIPPMGGRGTGTGAARATGDPATEVAAGAPATPGGGGAAASTAAALERALVETGRVDVFSIYFNFNRDVIREESESTLNDIASILRKHPGWTLAVEGHTDNVGGDQYNLELSRRRSDAVKQALVSRHGIDASRLVTAGHGASRPRDTNETLEGRARNRRVELVRK